MASLNFLESRLADAWPPSNWQEVTVLLAVSGGPDSVALLRCMVALRTAGKGRICVAHFNHHLRGDESIIDEEFVAALCRRLNVTCDVGRREVEHESAEFRDVSEAAARETRYTFLEKAASRLGARYVVTAHTADDQAETILHRIVRGTGIGGLRGMRRARRLGPAATLIRPLLAIRRAELLAYLEDLGQPYRSDTSNDDVRFTRNRIRRELLPRLAEQVNPSVVDALLRLGTLAGDVQTVIDHQVEELTRRAVAVKSSEAVRIDATCLVDQPRYVVRELLMAVWRRQHWPLQAMGFTQWDLLAEMASTSAHVSQQPTGKQTFPGSVSVEATEGGLHLVRIERPP